MTVVKVTDMIINMKAVTLLVVATLPNVVNAQTSAIDEFNRTRQEMLGDYRNFRKSVLDGYDNYLKEVWKEYKTFKGKVRDHNPKPKTLPNIEEQPAMAPMEDLPSVDVRPKETTPEKKKPMVQPVPTVVPGIPQQSVECSFYGVSVKVPRLEGVGMNDFSPEQTADAWRAYEGKGIAKKALDIKNRAELLGLNDWFTYEMVRECVNAQCDKCSVAERVTMMLYLLANMGYDVRMALANNEPCLLIAMRQQVYGRGYTVIDGKKYYIYNVDGGQPKDGGSLYTYSLPKDMEMGREMDMRIVQAMRICNDDGKVHYCQLEYGDITVTANVDIVQMEMLRHYPQMDIAQYAMSVVSPQLRQSVLEQIKPQIKGLTKSKAAEKLLRFVQFAFDYATDGEQHGYEKAYFFEENFYYPKNDCEDRAIFYAYLVRHLLGLDVHLVNFPGHECTAVCFEDDNVDGTGYMYNGKKYIICDPTYIGASIGQCMPQYRGVTPKVETF